MMRLDAGSAVGRRDFLRAGALSMLGGGLAGAAQNDVRCIFLMLVGGPSQLDTWDPKPDAPAEIRGPYRPIETNVAGIQISEIFPRMARQADKYSLIRGVHHTAAPIHDAGHQLIQTGRLFEGGVEHPHMGCVVSKLLGSKGGAPAHVLLPGPIGSTGGNLPHGQNAGYLGEAHDPLMSSGDVRGEPWKLRDKYGRNRFGRSCLMARRLIEAGTRFVTVNMFETVFDEITWDIHGAKPFSPISCYRDTVGPMFDMAYSALLEDLAARGLLAHTMVVAAGEFGRNPKLNAAGGRDHWPQCWTVLMGGGPVRCGMVLGSSDATGSEPKDRPVTPAEIAATIYSGFGIDPATELRGAGGPAVRLAEPGVQPIRELLA